MAQATGGDDLPITDFRPPVAPDLAPGMMTGWPWAALVAGILVLGGTNVAYPLMRTLAGTLGGVALAATITSRKSLWPRPDWTDGIVAGLIALFVLQLIPLPPALWTQLPGREAIAAIDREVFGQLLWRPISIDSEATWQTFAFLIPFLGTWLAFRSGDAVRRSGMVKGVWIGFALAAGLGLLQLAGFDFLHPFPMRGGLCNPDAGRRRMDCRGALAAGRADGAGFGIDRSRIHLSGMVQRLGCGPHPFGDRNCRGMAAHAGKHPQPN